MADMHEIDYKIFGDDMQFVEVELDPNEATVAEAGGMMYMDDGVEMETIFGDGSNQQAGGFLGALMGAGKRLLTGESLFMTVFLNRSGQKKRVAFGAPYPGKIVPIHLAEIGGELITQKDSFLAAAKGVAIGIAFQKKFGVGLFGGEGFIMQRLQGDGWAFVHAGGTLQERTLAPGEVIRVDTGCIVAFQPSVQYDIQYVGKIKSALFGGEGLFFATLRGPGRIWLQSLPLSRLAGRIIAAAPGLGKGGREEGSVLGGLGRLLDGDNSSAAERAAAHLPVVDPRYASSDDSSCSVSVSASPGGMIDPSRTPRALIWSFRIVVSTPARSRITTSVPPSRTTNPSKCRPSVVSKKLVAKPWAIFAAGRTMDSMSSARL